MEDHTRLTVRPFYIGLLLLSTLLYALLLDPNYDDGINLYHIRSTVQLSRPYYNDYFGEQFPFQKLSTTLFALVYTFIVPFSFKPLAFIHSALIIVNTTLVFAISKRYTGKQEALLASAIFFYYIMTHYWLSPTRPELWLLAVILLVFLLCELYLSTSRIRYLGVAAVLTGSIGLPIHTNASILYMYLTFFIVAHYREIARRDLLIIVLSLILSTIAGIAVILYPDPASFVRFMLGIASDGTRFRLLVGEVTRLRFFVLHRFYTHIGLLLGIITVTRWAKTSFSLVRWKGILGDYARLILYFGAVLVSLGVLPSAGWQSYVVYYLLPFVVFVCVQFYEFRPGKLSKRAIPMIMGISAIALLIKRTAFGGGPTQYEIAAFVFLAAPVVVASVFRVLGRSEMVYLALVFGIAFKLFGMYCDHSVYSAATELVATGAGEVLVSDPVFHWIAGERRFVNVHRPTELGADDWGVAVIGPSSQVEFENLMEKRACQHKQIARIVSKVDDRLIRHRFRDLTVYEFRCTECVDIVDTGL